MSATIVLTNATIGTDVETGQTRTGTDTAKFRCVVNTKRGDSENATWYSVEVYGATARGVGSLANMGHLAKGKRCNVVGELVSRTYTDRSGVERQSLDVSASRVEPVWEPRGVQAEANGDAVYTNTPF